jgi:hypothetical protein
LARASKDQALIDINTLVPEVQIHPSPYRQGATTIVAMANIQEKKPDVEAAADSLEPIESIKAGLSESYEDKTNKDFYGGSITDSYRLKSELIGKAMEEIGMGRYQWEVFIVTGRYQHAPNAPTQVLTTVARLRMDRG